MATDNLDTEDAGYVPAIRYTNRRRMAWWSMGLTALYVVGITAAAFVWSSAVAALIPLIPIMLVFLNWPQMAYFGVTHLVDRFAARLDIQRLSNRGSDE